MNRESAINLYARFHDEKFLPAADKLLSDPNLKDLAADLSIALGMAQSPGEAGRLGLAMVNEVLLVAMVEGGESNLGPEENILFSEAKK